jgi:hypothetical protein
MSQDGVAQSGVRESRDHCDLDSSQNLPRTHAEGREPKNPIGAASIRAFTNPRVSESVRARRLLSMGTLYRR